MIAVINENNCIGCTKCVKVCPVDAIIGSTRTVHTVLQNYCTGCNQCVLICPVKCIDLKSVPLAKNKWKKRFPSAF